MKIGDKVRILNDDGESPTLKGLEAKVCAISGIMGCVWVRMAESEIPYRRDTYLMDETELELVDKEVKNGIQR